MRPHSTLVAVWLTLSASAAIAQINTGEISGVVRDTSGGVLPGATVTARHDATGTVVERVTDAEGRFFLPGLRIGAWTVEARLTGLAPQVQKAVLEVGRTLALEFSLGVQGVTEQVQVERTVPLLQVTTAEISDVIDNREVVQLPLNGRNFLALAQLSDAGVVPPRRGPAAGGPAAERRRSAIRPQHLPPRRHQGHRRAVQQARDQSIGRLDRGVQDPESMYAAEFGGKASALINVVTRAGANTFRGSAFEFHRDDAFDSPNYFRPVGAEVPPLRQDQFGGALGGPLRRNRSFFFGSYEGLRMQRSLTRTFSVPGLTLNRGLRYEFNQHMYAVDNRLSSIDLEDRRFVIASDDNGAINPDSGALLGQIPLPDVTSQAAGWGRGLLDPSAVRLAPRLGFALALNDSRAVIRGGYGIFLNQWAYSVQTAFARNLPFFFTKQIDVPSDVRVPTMQTRDILTSNATGTVGGSIMDYYSVEYSQTWSGGLQYQILPSTVAEISYMGTWTLGADNATIRNVPEPGARAIQPRRPIFNLLNRANFDLPNRIFGNPNFGRIFSAKGPREMQFGLRFAF